MEEKDILEKDFEENREQILKQLRDGKDIMIKNTGKGLKVQSLQVKNISR